MVLSKLNPEIDYPENTDLNEKDNNIDSQAWYYNLYNNNIIIAIGSLTMVKNIATVPIYLISKDEKVISQIGLFEMDPKNYESYLEEDADGDKILNINKLGEPLIYNREKFLSLQTASPQKPSLVASPQKPSLAVSLPEQTKEMAEAEYEEKPSGVWINKYLNNPHFRIDEVKPDGNCFFYVIRDAMNSVGNNYTIDDLRKMLLSYPKLEETYNEEREIIKGILEEIEQNEKEYTDCTTTLKSKSVKTQSDKEAYKKKCDEIKEKVHQAEELLEPFIAIKDIDTFEAYKKYVLDKKCWATEWSIQHIENTLNIKVIIFNHFDYEEGKMDKILTCTQSDVTAPDYYILANYINNNHYQSVFFKDALVFKFDRLLYILRSKIVERCIIGKDASSWSKLVDFKDFERIKITKKKKDIPCKGLTEEECIKKSDECKYKKGPKRQYCAKKIQKK